MSTHQQPPSQPDDFPGLDLEAWRAALPFPEEQAMFEPVKSTESISEDQLKLIARSLGPIQSMVLHIGDVDVAAGAGIVNDHCKCLWTKDGRRITLDMQFGGFIGSITDEPDPAKPAVPKPEPPYVFHGEAFAQRPPKVRRHPK